MSKEENIYHQGTVICVENDYATVRFQRNSMCNHCKICKSIDDNSVCAVVLNKIKAQEGDVVIVDFPGKKLIKASVVLYLIPLLVFLIGLILGHLINEMVSAIMAVCGCGLSFFIIRYIDRKVKTNNSYLPYISSVINNMKGNMDNE